MTARHTPRRVAIAIRVSVERVASASVSVLKRFGLARVTERMIPKRVAVVISAFVRRVVLAVVFVERRGKLLVPAILGVKIVALAMLVFAVRAVVVGVYVVRTGV